MPFNCLSFDLINGFARRVCFLRGARLAVACCSLLTVSTVALAQGDPGDAKVEVDMKEYTQKIRNTEISFKMVPIPGGEFLMGSADAESDRNADEGPQHKVKLEPFWMGKTEVTWDEFELWSIRLERAAAGFWKFRGWSLREGGRCGDETDQSVHRYVISDGQRWWIPCHLHDPACRKNLL